MGRLTLLAKIKVAALDALITKANQRVQAAAIAGDQVMDGEIARIVNGRSCGVGRRLLLLGGLWLLYYRRQWSHLNMHSVRALHQENLIVILVDHFDFILISI